MSRLGDFLRNREKEISGTTAIVGVLIGIIGFWATWNQLSRTEETLRAANTYQIQKDAREIVSDLSKSEALQNAISSGIIKDDSKSEIIRDIWLMFNFYLSVYRQDEAGGLSSSFIDSFKKDFCGFISKKIISDTWDVLSKEGKLSDGHADMRRKWCI